MRSWEIAMRKKNRKIFKVFKVLVISDYVNTSEES